ncbi:MAG: ABC transporter substrate-binding protein [Spirochaetes bacterium]|nr:ABC transporter substrate-binding protein [Spirochaetota bacterium]
MKKLKSMGVLILALFLLLSVGCKKSDAENASELKEYEIVWYTIGTPQKDTSRVMEELSKYTKEKINVTVKMVMIDWGPYTDKMRMIISSGENYDICFTSSWANDYRTNATKGAFLPLNDLLDKHGKELKDALHPAFLEGTKINGVNYAIPVNKEVGSQHVFRFNKKYLNKYNLDISNIKTFEDLEPLLEVIKKNEPGIVPLVIYGNTDWVFENYDPLLGGGDMPGIIDIAKNNLKVFNQFETEEYLNHLKTIRRFYQKGYIPQDAGQVKDNNSLVQSGKWFCGRAETQPYADKLWSRSAGYEIVSIPYFQKPVTSSRSVSGSMMAISNNCEDPERVMMFLNMLNTDPYVRNMVNYGIEGVHYEKLDTGKIKFLKAHHDYNVPAFSLGNLFITYLFEDDPDDKWQKFEEFNNASTVSPLTGFVFNPESVNEEVTAIRNVVEEYKPSINTGSVDPEEYLAKFNKKLKTAGLDKVLNEMQKQIDEWSAKQSGK